MKIIETSIDGLVIVEPAIYGDERGYFFEAYNQANYVAAGIRADFVQDNLSFSLRGVLRGLHGQNPNSQGKLVSCLQGEIFDVAVDLREGSPTFGKWESVILSPKIGRQFFIPRCFAHGFLVLSESALFSYKVDSYYDPKSEYSIRWDDPEIGIVWPEMDSRIISGRDRAGISLSEFAGRVGVPT
jgi:dTDP-4-dehydrorhamnose 3,5-epimerase